MPQGLQQATAAAPAVPSVFSARDLTIPVSGHKPFCNTPRYLLHCIYTMLQGWHNPLQNNPSPRAGSTHGHSYNGQKGGACTAKGPSITVLPKSSMGMATVPHNKLPHNLLRGQADKVLRAPWDTPPGVLSLGVHRAGQDLCMGLSRDTHRWNWQ